MTEPIEIARLREQIACQCCTEYLECDHRPNIDSELAGKRWWNR